MTHLCPEKSEANYKSTGHIANLPRAGWEPWTPAAANKAQAVDLVPKAAHHGETK